MRYGLALVFMLSVVPVVRAQIQDSHFYKVSESEISSDFTFDGFWKSEVEGSFFRNGERRERLMKIKLFAKLDIDLFSSFGAEFEPYLEIEEGEVQRRRFVSVESNPLRMRQGFFYYRPVEGLSIQAGAINQDFLSSPLLMKDQTFLSFLSGYAYIKEKYEFQSVAQFSLPSIINTFRRYNEIEEAPYFVSLFNYGEWIPSSLLSFKGHVTGFYFSELPSFIATQSRLYGNTVDGTLSNTAFRYGYYGVDADISSQVKLSSKVYLSLGYNILVNFDTQFSEGMGERIYAIFDMNFWKAAKLYSRFEYFHNGSDSAPAYYNSEHYGHNNRKCFLAELKSFFPKGNFEVGLRYVLSQPINEAFGEQQEDRQHLLSLFVSTRYFSI